MHPLDEAIRRALTGVPGIGTIVVFGSRAGDSPRPDSDLDVGLLPEVANPGERRDLVVRVAVQLAHFAPQGRLDVVLMDEVPAALRQELMRTGRMITSSELDRWQALRVATMREYGDS